MGRSGIEQMLYLMDQAFEGSPDGVLSWHAILVNLRSLRDEDWDWLPPGGRRTVRVLVQDLGECKYVYDNHAFGDASMAWSKPGSVPTIEDAMPPAKALEWLQEAHRRLRGHVAALEDDAELVKPRRANWGKEYETRWLIKTMIEHDLYHAGEINHIRALAQGND